MMDMKSRNQYLFTLIQQNGGYHLKNKKEKGEILNEYCQVTGQRREAVSRKIRNGKYILSMRKEKGEEKRTRFTKYTHEVTAYLIKLWEIFDRPCGQRLSPMIRRELDRLIRFGELSISQEMREVFQTISPRTIDTKLAKHKEKERLKRVYAFKQHPLLYQKVPVKLSLEQGREIGDTIQIDLVEHCGQSAQGSFLSTLSVTDIGSGWWEGEPVFGKSASYIAQGLGRIEYRFPFLWKEIHSDNGSEFINEKVFEYAVMRKLHFSRSRPYMKNDNCFVEQKNSTHVRRIIGYHRYDTKKEQEVLRELYRNELRWYKNFFQPIIPLISKERVGGHIKRRYGEPKTPYQRILEDENIAKEIKEKLMLQYESLNPAELKRKILQYQNMLYQLYQKKQQKEVSPQESKVEGVKKLSPHWRTSLFAEPMRIREHELVA
jgi:hypothetical protein